MINLILQVLELGSIYALLVAAVHLTSNVIGIDDFSIEGSFAVGGALGIVLAHAHVPLGILVPGILLAGITVGLMTSGLFVLVGIDSLLSGIIVTTGLFSCNLKIAGAQATLDQTLFDALSLGPQNHWVLLVPLAIGIISVLWWLLQTEVGLCLRAVGDNPGMLTHIGKNPHVYITGGIVLANMLAAFAGLLFVHHVGFFSITGSIGTLISALAGLIIGQAVCGSWLGGILIGAVLYQAIIATVIYQQCDPAWNKLITAIVIVLLVVFKHLKKHTGQQRRIS